MRHVWQRWAWVVALSALLHLILLMLLAGRLFWSADPGPPGTLRLLWVAAEQSPPPLAPAPPPAPPPALPPAVPAPVPPTPPSPHGTRPPQSSPLPLHWQQALQHHRTPSTFFGRPFGGGRVVFVIDISGSMLQKSGTTTRLAEAFGEVMRAIATLGSSQEFNIVLFADRVDAFQPDPVRAQRENILRAFAYLDSGVDCGGSTNLQDALRLAIAMRPDTILLLSDGEANTEDEAILAEARHLRGLHNPRMTLHAVGFHLPPGSHAERFLRRLVAEHSGTYWAWKPAPGS